MECTEAGLGFRDWTRAGVLPAEARAHVESCAACAELWERERELTAALSALPAPAGASPRVQQAVLAALPMRRIDPRPILALAALLLLSMVAGWYLSRPKPRVETVSHPVYTDFFPLTAPVALDRHEASQLIRIRLPRREMRRFGLAVSEELERSPIEADVLLGHDGVARAVRFVSGHASVARPGAQ